jgi:hypothetical protein
MRLALPIPDRYSDFHSDRVQQRQKSERTVVDEGEGNAETRRSTK